jgi:hypothetical protein
MSTNKNIHHGSDFTKFLRDEGIYDEVEAAANEGRAQEHRGPRVRLNAEP